MRASQSLSSFEQPLKYLFDQPKDNYRDHNLFDCMAAPVEQHDREHDVLNQAQDPNERSLKQGKQYTDHNNPEQDLQHHVSPFRLLLIMQVMILTIRTLPDTARIVFFLGVRRTMTESVSRIQLSLERTADFAIHMLAILYSGTVLGIRGFSVEHARYANIPLLIIVGCTF